MSENNNQSKNSTQPSAPPKTNSATPDVQLPSYKQIVRQKAENNSLKKHEKEWTKKPQ